MKKAIYLVGAATFATALLHADGEADNQAKMRRQPASNKYGTRMTEGLFITGDFLYWIAHEDGLEYAVTGINSPDNPANIAVTRGSTKNVNFRWDPGFRVGLGYTIGESFWDLSLTWTRYHTRAKGTSTHSGNPSIDPLLSILEHPGFLGEFSNLAGLMNSATAKWRLRYDTVDLELARSFYPNKHLAVKPHFGVRGALIGQRYSNLYDSTNAGATNEALISRRLKNNYWAAGFKTGLDSLFSFNRYFGIYGNASVSLMGGKFHITEKDTTISAIDVTPNIDFINISDRFFSVVPALEAAMGFHLALGPQNKRWRFELNTGWEYLLWFNQNQMPLFTDSSNLGVSIRQRGNLQLMGGTINAKLHF